MLHINKVCAGGTVGSDENRQTNLRSWDVVVRSLGFEAEALLSVVEVERGRDSCMIIDYGGTLSHKTDR